MKSYYLKTDRPQSAAKLLEEQGVHLAMPCGGIGKCGKCKIRIRGALSKPSAHECALLTEEQLRDGYRLGCFVKVLSSAEVLLEDHSLCAESDSVFAYAFTEENLHGTGIAVDIGTTTVAAAVIDFDEKRQLEAITFPNPQSFGGADTVARIFYAQTEGIQKLSRAIRDKLSQITERYPSLSRMVITGNTVMLHLFTQQDPSGLGAWPFQMADSFGYYEKKDGFSIYYPPCLSAFVGADISCGILAAADAAEEFLLVDMGTNGELALWHKQQLYTASVSAGPAFEGCEVSCGMAAEKGAVSKVYLEDGYKIRFSVIGNTAPAGLCGSGMIDALSVFLELGIIDRSGEIQPGGHRHPQLIGKRDGRYAVQIGTSGIWLTQEDIRRLQLAKAAFRAGILLLLKSAGLRCVKDLFLAGGFGKYINPDNAVKIGLLPADCAERITAAGNTSLAGAIKLLCEKDGAQRCREIAQKNKTLQLAKSEEFNQLYMECISF